MSDNSEVIDLTSSFTLADHCDLRNEVINIDSDESLELSEANKNDRTVLKTNTNQPSYLNKQQDWTQENKTGQFGDCPICWTELGDNPLASTKCGHVFCIKCLMKSLAVEKKCPTCRLILRGRHAYHRLFLSRH